jgi:hypothetical protein
VSPSVGNRPKVFNNDERWMARAQPLFLIVILISLGWLNVTSFATKPAATLVLSSTIIILGLWPSYRWLGNRNRDDIPVLQLHGVFYAISFGVPGFLPINESYTLLRWISEDDRQVALLLATAGLACLYLGYYHGAGILLGRVKSWQAWPLVISPNFFAPIVVAAVPILSVLSLLLASFGLGVFKQVVSAVYDFFFIAIAYAAFSGKLRGGMRYAVVFGLIPYQIAMGLAGGAIADAFQWLVVIGLIYASVRKRIPYLWILLALALFFLLQPVKGSYRVQMATAADSVPIIERIQNWAELGWDFYFGDGRQGAETGEKIEQSYSRLDHLTVTTAIIADTPTVQPLVLGETYIPLATKWIPRFLWPGKPSENIGNSWALRYGYLHRADDVTSFNLPWLPEMYMNFGVGGILGVSLLLGILFRAMADRFWSVARDESSFAFGMTLGLACVFPESNLSLTLGGVIIVAITLFIVGKLLVILRPRVFAWKSSH